MANQLAKADRRKLADLESKVDLFRSIYLEAGLALMIIRDEQLYADLAPTFDEYVKKRFGFTSRHANRLISAFEAVDDVKDVTGPTGPEALDPPRNEAVARELAKAESPEKRADLWLAVNSEVPPHLVTASKVAKVRREKFGEEENSNTVTVKPMDAIRSLIKKVDAVRRAIDEIQPIFKTDSKEWKTALDELDEGRKALARLVK